MAVKSQGIDNRSILQQRNAVVQGRKHSCTVLIYTEDILPKDNVLKVYSAVVQESNLCCVFLPEGDKEMIKKDFEAASKGALKNLFQDDRLVMQSKKYFHEEEYEVGRMFELLRNAPV